MQQIPAIPQKAPLLHGYVSGHLLHPLFIGMRSHSCQADLATLQMNEEGNRDLGIELPPVPPPPPELVTLVLAVRLGRPPIRTDGTLVMGKLGQNLDADAGYEAARLAAIGVLAILRQELGALDKVRRIVKVNGVVIATPDFLDHAKVINGASDLFVQVFGEAGSTHGWPSGVPRFPGTCVLRSK